MYLPAIEKLYVIGNGFDKHHGMKCGYFDFRNWLQDNRKDVYDNMVRIYGDLDNDWWSAFEENLTNFNPDQYPYEVSDATFFKQLQMLEQRYGAEGREFMNDYEMNRGTIRNQFDRCAEVARFEMEHLKDDICESYGEWVKEIKLPDESKKDCRIDKNAFFFTFNYTRTLEDLYDIDDDQIVHLHGSVDDNEFVIGHNMTAEEMQHRYLENYMYDHDPDDEKGESNARISMFEVVEELKKPVDDIIEKHGDDFYSLNTIKELEVLGFSYSKIDLPYLKRIFEITGPDISVKFGWHTGEDKSKAEDFKQEMKLTNCILFEF